MSRTYVRARDVTPVSKGKGRLSRQLVTRAETGVEAFAMGLNVTEPRTGAGTHVHESSSETMYIIQGELKFTIDGEDYLVEPDSVIHVPAGVPHSYANLGDTESKFVWIFNPPTVDHR